MTDPQHLEPVSGRALRRRRLQLVLLALVFMAPVIAAWVVWNYVGEHGIGGTSNAGALVVPARPLTVSGLQDQDGNTLGADRLRGRWTYLVLAPKGCAADCERQLLDTRQVRISVNKDMPRVQRLLVLGAMPSTEARALLLQAHPDLLVAVAPGVADATLLGEVAAAGVVPDGGHFLLVDPLGNLMMSYGPEVPLQGVLKDLRKLLKASQIG